MTLINCGDIEHLALPFNVVGVSEEWRIDNHYDPMAGRFINEGKYEGTVTNPLSINVYSYANNNPVLYIDPTGNISWRQFDTLLGGVADGLLGLSNLKSLFNGEALQGMIQFGKAVLSGNISFVDIAKSVGASFVQPFQYLAEHSKNVWTGKPADQEVYEYGKSMGNAIQTIVDVAVGGSIAGAKIVKALGKVCPKLMKAIDKAADTIRGITKGAGKAVEGGSKVIDNARPFTKSSLKLGQEMHKAYKADVVDGITKFKEYRLPSGKRIDFIDFETKTIYELKPYNPNQLKAGTKQLGGYLEEVEETFGEGWKTFLDTY